MILEEMDPDQPPRGGDQARRLPHIDIRESLVSLCYIPLIHKEELIGVLEILAFEEEITGRRDYGADAGGRSGRGGDGRGAGI